MVATFKEMCALTSRKHLSEPGMSVLNLSQKLPFFLSQFYFFSLEKQPKNMNDFRRTPPFLI